jgi:hypothetical protein
MPDVKQETWKKQKGIRRKAGGKHVRNRIENI